MDRHPAEIDAPRCDVCGARATTLDGIVGAYLCDDPECLDIAWTNVNPPDGGHPGPSPRGDR